MTLVDEDLDLDAPPCDDYDDDTGPKREVVSDFEIRDVTERGDGLTLVGYAAVFNSPTQISSYQGDFTEQIAPGAFKRSINAHKPVIQFDHGNHPLIGSLPIAAARRLKEDGRGLWLEARVFNNWLTEPLRDAITEQAIHGMSFRFSVVKDTWENGRKEKIRTLNEVRLYELGPVVFPAYADTSVALRSLERVTGLQILGTSPAPADNGTAGEPAIDADPALGHSARTKNQRRALALLTFQGDPYVEAR